MRKGVKGRWGEKDRKQTEKGDGVIMIVRKKEEEEE